MQFPHRNTISLIVSCIAREQVQCMPDQFRKCGECRANICSMSCNAGKIVLFVAGFYYCNRLSKKGSTQHSDCA